MIETGLYQHFNGNVYRVIATATHTETGESMVVYHSMFDNYAEITLQTVKWEKRVHGLQTSC